MKELFRQLLFIRKCVGCGALLSIDEDKEAFCRTCRSIYEMAKTVNCPVCFQEAVACTCMPPALKKRGAVCLRKLFFYRKQERKKPQNRLLYHIKRRANLRMEEFIARELARSAREELALLENASKENVVLTYLPRTERARRTYGFDQSARVLQALSREMDLPWIRALVRGAGGGEQKHLDREGRFQNVQKRFRCLDSEGVKDKYVILLDDIVTTGASMAAGVSCLQKAGAKKVICLCMARDEKPKRV